MRKVISIVLFALFLGISVYAQDEIKISLKNGSEGEQKTKEQLQRLLKTYDLSKWMMTKTFEIDEKALPHSHPILTFSTRYLKDDELLVSIFIHEQMHWLMLEKAEQSINATREFREMFPKVPASLPEGARSEESTYLHIAVVYLEYRGNKEVFGELKAKQIMDFWATDHYTWIYKTVLERTRDIGNIMSKHNLIPALPTKSAAKKT